jgi:hypothetical protein
VRLEGLGQLKNPMYSSRIEPCDLAPCSVLPQPSTLSSDLKVTYPNMPVLGFWSEYAVAAYVVVIRHSGFSYQRAEII